MEKVGENRMKHKKVLIVANVQGFVSDFLRNDIEILKRNQYEIHVAANEDYLLDDTISYFIKNRIETFHVCFPVRSLDAKEIYRAYRSLQRIIDNNKYEIVHCHTPIAAAITRAITKNRKNIKVIYTSHGFPFYEGNKTVKAKLFFVIEKWLSKCTDAIITICNEDYQNAKKMFCPKVYLMHGVGIDLDKYNLYNFNRNAYRANLGFSADDKIILAIGEINTNKNHQILIKALKKLSDPKMILVICGRELTEKGKQHELEDLASNLGVRIKFLGFRKDIPEICHCADIGAISSFKEGLGLSGVEMLASGIPVVGSNRQGIKDYVIDGKTGYLADPEDSDSFAKAISKCFHLLNSSFTGNDCREMAGQYDIKRSYKTIEYVYKEIGI